MLYSKLVQGERRTPRHSEVEQQEEGRRSTIGHQSRPPNTKCLSRHKDSIHSVSKRRRLQDRIGIKGARRQDPREGRSGWCTSTQGHIF